MIAADLVKENEIFMMMRIDKLFVVFVVADEETSDLADAVDAEEVARVPVQAPPAAPSALFRGQDWNALVEVHRPIVGESKPLPIKKAQMSIQRRHIDVVQVPVGDEGSMHVFELRTIENADVIRHFDWQKHLDVLVAFEVGEVEVDDRIAGEMNLLETRETAEVDVDRFEPIGAQ